MTTAMLAALISACALLVASTSASAAVATRPSNQAVATRAAVALVRHTPRPPTATRSRTEPAGDGGLLAQPPDAPATHTLIDRHVIYVVPASLPRVLRFYAHHRPAHARQIASGRSGGSGVPANLNLTWAYPASTAAIVSRQAVIDLVALPHGTGIRVDAQVVARVPRPAGERVPAGVSAVSISRAKPGEMPDLSRTVTKPARVRQIVAMIDRLPIVQPAAIACPVLLADTPMVAFSFRASPAGPALATASEPSDVTEPTSACDALTFATGAHAWPSLLRGARFLHRVDRLVHARFATPPGVADAATPGR